jgi:hypothetical protein
MTGEQLYQRMQARVAALVDDIPPHKRHRFTAKWIHSFCELLRDRADPTLWQEFDDAMYAHGYHRHSSDSC